MVLYKIIVVLEEYERNRAKEWKPPGLVILLQKPPGNYQGALLLVNSGLQLRVYTPSGMSVLSHVFFSNSCKKVLVF